MSPLTLAFTLGAICTGYAACALFFLRYFRRTRDRLFLIFAVAFAVLAGTQVGFLATVNEDREWHELYWLRLAAYACIMAGILDKNRR